MEQYTDAEEMARAHGLENGKTFRSRLRRNLTAEHTPGSWRVVIGSAKHRLAGIRGKRVAAGA